MEAIHPIGVVERRTGLSTHVIRVWERRYGAVAPKRSEGNQRLYTDADIDRLVLLAKAVANGESIGRIARLPNGELQSIAMRENQAGRVPYSPSENRSKASLETNPAIQRAIESVQLSDNKQLRSIISEWLYTYGIANLTERLVPDLLTHIGDKWESGELEIYQEHIASETVRSFLGTVLHDLNSGNRGKTAITATPPGELHDIGALLSAIAAAASGFDVVHLGPDVPFVELIRLSLIRKPVAILLSFVFKSSDERLVQGLRNLREMIDPDTRLFIGGRSAGWYGNRLQGTGIQHLSGLSDLRAALATLASSY